jgi:hypothetical protein
MWLAFSKSSVIEYSSEMSFHLETRRMAAIIFALVTIPSSISETERLASDEHAKKLFVIK